MRLIDGDALINEFDQTFLGNNPRGVIRATIENAPTIEPERKRGKWICWLEKIENDTFEYVWKLPHCKCSECGTEYDWYTVKFINFCSYCGADMRGENNG